MTATLWMDIERTFLVIERVDRGTPSGVREVSFVLATSELAQVEVPDLSDPDDTDKELDPDLYTDDPTPPEFGPETQPIIKIDPWSTVFAGFDLPGGSGAGGGGGSGSLPWDGGSMLPNCCEEPPITVTEVGEPPVVEPPPGGGALVTAAWRSAGGDVGGEPPVITTGTIDLPIRPVGYPYAIVALTLANTTSPGAPGVPTLSGGAAWTMLANVSSANVRFTVFGAEIDPATSSEDIQWEVIADLISVTLVGVDTAGVISSALESGGGSTATASVATTGQALMVLLRAFNTSEPTPGAGFTPILREGFWGLGGANIVNSVIAALADSVGSTSQTYTWSGGATWWLLVLDLEPPP